MTMAFVLGNGISRQGIDPHMLQAHGRVYGCNALYREFEPDVLVATDRPISHRIQDSGYARTHRFHTRRPLADSGAQPVPHEYFGYSSGPIAVALAAQDRHSHIYMLGFDLGPTADNTFNNLYAGTEFYRPVSATPTFTGNWVRQLTVILGNHPQQHFYRVMGDTTARIPQLDTLANLIHLTRSEFLDRINTPIQS